MCEICGERVNDERISSQLEGMSICRDCFEKYMKTDVEEYLKLLER